MHTAPSLRPTATAPAADQRVPTDAGRRDQPRRGPARLATPGRLLALTVALVTIVAALPAAARAAELLPSGTFDTSITGWNPAFVPPNGSLSCVHSAKNSGDEAAASGSLQCSLVPPAIATVNGPCFALAPDATYVWSGDSLSAGTTGLNVDVNLVLYPAANCTGIGIYAPIARRSPGEPWTRERVVFRNRATHGLPQPPAAARVELSFGFGPGNAGGATQTVWFDNLSVVTAPYDLDPGQQCSVNDDRARLCLNKHRFRVDGTFTTAQGATGPLQGVPLTDDAGVFYFTNPNNLELNVKVLDACSFNGHYWVFASGSTTVGIQLLVTDLSDGTVSRSYANPVGGKFVTVTDTTAFPCN